MWPRKVKDGANNAAPGPQNASDMATHIVGLADRPDHGPLRTTRITREFQMGNRDSAFTI